MFIAMRYPVSSPRIRFLDLRYQFLTVISKMAAMYGRMMQSRVPGMINRLLPAIESKAEQYINRIGSQGEPQLISLVHQIDPRVETLLVPQLQMMPPEKAAIFFQNWQLLDGIVRQEIARRTGGKRKTRRRKNRK